MVPDDVRSYLAQIGRKGGKVSGIRKGLAALPLSKRREIARKGVEARRKKK